MPRIFNPQAQWKDADGIPVAGGTLVFFENRATVKKAIFSDKDLSVAQSNPYTLDGSGRVIGDVWFSGLTSIQVNNTAGGQIRIDDDVESNAVDSEVVRSTKTVATMVADTTWALDDFISVEDYATGNNSGVLFFKVVAAGTGTADGGQYIDLPNTTPALQAKQNFPSVITIKMFGAVEGVSNSRSAIQTALGVAFSEGISVVQLSNGGNFSVDPSTSALIINEGVYLDLNWGKLTRIGTDKNKNIIENFESSAAGSEKTITAATQANPCVITLSAAHGLAVGDKLYINAVLGMTELNFETYEVGSVPTTTTLSLLDTNSTSFTAYTSAGKAVRLGQNWGVYNGSIIGTGKSVGVTTSQTGHAILAFKSYNALIENIETEQTNGDSFAGRLSFETTLENILMGSFGRNQISPTSGTFSYNNVRSKEWSIGISGASPGVFFDAEPDNANEISHHKMSNSFFKDATFVDFFTAAAGDSLIHLNMSTTEIGAGSPVGLKLQATNNINAKNIVIDGSNRFTCTGTSSQCIEVENMNYVSIDGPSFEGFATSNNNAVFIDGVVNNFYFRQGPSNGIQFGLRVEGTDTLDDSELVNLTELFLSGDNNNIRACNLTSLTISNAATTGNIFHADCNLPSSISVSDSGDLTKQIWNKRDELYTPTINNLTEVGGSATIQAKFVKVGKLVDVQVKIIPVTNTSAVNTGTPSTSTNISLPFPADRDSIHSVGRDLIGTSPGVCQVDSTNDFIIMPAWTTETDTKVISVTYQASE